MVIVGLTGSIGMGKSLAARQLRRMGLPVHDADAAVHQAMAVGGDAVGTIAERFPGAVKDGQVDRSVLRSRVTEDPTALERLEDILHPLVRQAERAFLSFCARRREPLVVLDIPLLFETGAERRMDAVIVVTAPRFLQSQRVLRRPGMTADWLDRIRREQMPDREKCRRADFVVQTGRGKADSLRVLRRIVKVLRERRGTHWPPWPRPTIARH